MWPLPGATEVPTDTPLVVSRYNLAGSTERIGFRLIDADGAEVSLTEVNRLAPAYVGCGASETLFLRPARSLRAHAQYTLALADDMDPAQASGTIFTTSDVSFRAEASPPTTFDYLLVTEPSCDDASCFELAEARVDLGEAPREPRWLVVESAALEHGHNAHVFGVQGGETPAETQLSVAVLSDDHCIDARLYGVDGKLLWEQRRCQPDRCAHTDATTFNSCGGPPLSGLRATDVPPQSCNAPPTIEQPGASPEPALEGCQVSPSARSVPGVLGAFAALLAARSTRRRSRR